MNLFTGFTVSHTHSHTSYSVNSRISFLLFSAPEA